MENNERRIPGLTNYSDCIAAFKSTLSNDDLGDSQKLFSSLEEIGVDPITARMVRGLNLPGGDYLGNVVFGLKIKWEYEWKKKFPELAGIEDRFKSMKDDRFLSDPEFDALVLNMPKDFESLIEDTEIDDQVENISDRAEDWVEEEEGLTWEDLEGPIASKHLYIVFQMANFLRGVGKRVPAEITEFLEYNTPKSDDPTNKN